jgi:cyclase
MMPKDAWDWLRKITSTTKKGIALLINTDYQVERILGNCFFPASTTIGHQFTWSELQRYDEAYLQRHISHMRDCDAQTAANLSKTRIVPPELTLTSDLTVHKGGRTFRLIFAGGHSPANIMVHLPHERILFSGDVVVNGEHPCLAQANSMRWLHTLETIRRLNDLDLVVPGRGEPCNPMATEMLSDYIQKLRERVHECFSEGCTRRESVDRVRMLDFYPAPASRREEIERRVRASVERVYDEFKKENEKKHHLDG